jgi:hypothetical protein
VTVEQLKELGYMPWYGEVEEPGSWISEGDTSMYIWTTALMHMWRRASVAGEVEMGEVLIRVVLVRKTILPHVGSELLNETLKQGCSGLLQRNTRMPITIL